MRKSFVLTSLVLLLILFFGLFNPATAQPDSYRQYPYNSYIYDFWGNVVPSPQAYLPTSIITGRDIGVNLGSLRDIHVSGDQVYLVDSGNDQLIILNSDFELYQVIDEFGEEDHFNNPRGVYVSHEDEIYVADRDNNRVVVLNLEGDLSKIIEAPDPEVEGIIPPDFRFRPSTVGVDQAGRIYIIAEGVYDGLMEYDDEGNFRGFIGAPRVAPSVADYLWRTLGTEEQRRRMALFLPVQHSGIDIDDRGFIYATVTGGATAEEERVRRLNPSGDDVLRREGFFPPVGDLGVQVKDEGGSREDWTAPRSTLIDIIARENGMYSVLDRTMGRIFTYDDRGNLLYVFGGIGSQRGLIQVPTALEELDNKILVTDSRANQITVYEPTRYAAYIHSAINNYYQGRYDRSTEQWRNVLRHNANYDLAYTGIGRALLRQDEFGEAMRNFRLGQNRQDFSEAFALYRRIFLSERFGSIILGLFSLVLFIYLIRKVKFKKQEEAADAIAASGGTVATGSSITTGETLSSRLRFALHVILHPFGGFWDLKHEDKGNITSASILLGLVILTYVFIRQYTGFIFNPRRIEDLNIFVEMASILVPFGLWCVVNWSLTTLMDGKGTLKEIYIFSAYALTPIILLNLPATIISNGLTLDEGAFYYTLSLGAVIWAVGLLFSGTMVTHDYDIPKTTLTCIIVLAGMGFIIFVGFFFFIIIDELLEFVTSIYSEITLRVD